LPRPAHIVVFRFSALGDVAMTVPVIKLLLQQHPDLHVTYVSTGFMQPLFEGIERLDFLSADLKGRNKGLPGLYRLYKTIRKEKSIDAIADLHDVLRTKIIRGFFSFSGLKTAFIDKGRKEKAELTRIENKDFHPLKSTFERYADVFARLGYPVVLNATVKPAASRQPPAAKAYGDGTQPVAGGQSLWRRNAASNKGNFKYKIGIAPFAKHLQKQYPIEKIEAVVKMLNADNDKEIIFFGGKENVNKLQSLEKEFPNTKNYAGKFSLQEELQIMSTLDLMVSMDSANMHLASLVNVPVVSVWGGTHPYAGFYGWQQDPLNAVQVDLYCRPCSVFGKRTCYRKDWACLHSINPVSVYDKIVQQLYRSTTV
jgi:ADP-heptose:LPS heptosyltransferase